VVATVVIWQETNAKSMVWSNIALAAPDQLRQRVAFALSQIVVVGEGGSQKKQETEVWHNFHDILVRHAFGNFRDLMKEVVYSPLMGDYLTYRNNKASESAPTLDKPPQKKGCAACPKTPATVHTGARGLRRWGKLPRRKLCSGDHATLHGGALETKL